MGAGTTTVPAGPGRATPPAVAAAPGDRRPPTTDPAELADAARRIRRRAVQMVAPAGLGYLGQAMSSADVFAVLYRAVLRHDVDRFVLSPGHYVITHYAAAAEAGLLAEHALATYGVDGSWLESISTDRTPLVAATCGALGQGLSVAVGLALADALAVEDRRTYAFCSDGEMEEGQVWEAAMFAAHHGLSALTAVFDCNGSQVDGPVATVTTLEPLADKWRAFGWDVHEVDGHNVQAVLDAFRAAAAVDGRPSVVLARTSMRAGFPSLAAAADAHFVALGPGGAEQALDDLGGGTDPAPQGARR
ncbi:MAG: transketolase [Acidimicrobiales bacterium]